MDVRDVSFRSLSKDKILCVGAKPSDALLPDKFLMLAPKVICDPFIFICTIEGFASSVCVPHGEGFSSLNVCFLLTNSHNASATCI